MKYTIILILLSILPVFCFANEIDKLKSDEDVDEFLQKIDSNYRLTQRSELSRDTSWNKTIDSLGFKMWQKVDLDDNGTTDLLVNVRYDFGENYLIAIMDNEGKYSKYYISVGSFPEQYYPLVRKINNTTMILLYKDIGNDSPAYDSNGVFKLNSNHKIAVVDTLLYKFQSFINYSGPHNDYQIKHITFSTTECFGSCPVFTLDVDAKKSMVYQAKKYNYRNVLSKKNIQIYDSGRYEAKADLQLFNKLTTLLNYTDFIKLNDKYAVGWTDDAACYLTITYGNGLVKKIFDYGEMGTFSLREIYHQLYHIRNTGDWVRKE